VRSKRKLNERGFYNIRDGRGLGQRGFYDVRGVGEITTIDEFRERAFAIQKRARLQTQEDVIALKRNMSSRSSAKLQWNDCFRPYMSKDMAWVLKWHSIQRNCEPLMDAGDRALFEKYYKPFVPQMDARAG